VYGAQGDPVSVSVDPKSISSIVHGSTGYNTIFTLAIAGAETTAVMVVDRQVDPVKGNVLHVDFKRIDLTKRIRVTIPVLTEGEPAGVKVQGGLLEIISRAIEIECLPDDIPERYVVDVADLMVGQSRRAGSIALGGSVKLVSAPETVIAHIVTLRAEEATAEAEAAPATAEPEVVKKGKKEEEAADDKGKKK
jgi:large subunit ribosomal protein L25